MSLFEELKRRNVFRVGIACAPLGRALLQGADYTLEPKLASAHMLVAGYPRWSWGDRFVEARALPAFREKIERANLPELWDAIGPPPACRKTANGYDCANGGTP